MDSGVSGSRFALSDPEPGLRVFGHLGFRARDHFKGLVVFFFFFFVCVCVCFFFCFCFGVGFSFAVDLGLWRQLERACLGAP